jgi:hypothetical protein
LPASIRDCLSAPTDSFRSLELLGLGPLDEGCGVFLVFLAVRKL